MKRTLIYLTVGALCCTMRAAEMNEGRAAVAELFQETEGRVLIATQAVGTFRERAADHPNEAVAAFFDESAATKWRTRVCAEFQSLALCDFFRGGILISGPEADRSAIVGIYNPWWDAILLLKGGLDDKKGYHAREFHLLSGETFRDERTEELRAVTVIPEARPLSLELWTVTAGTKRRFEALFPSGGRVSWGQLSSVLLSMDAEREFRRLAYRSGLRLQQMLAIAKNAKGLAVGRHVAKMAREGSLFQLYTYFREPNSRKLLSSFVKVPEMFRRDFSLYGYVPTQEGTLYVVVNRKFPRFYVTATVPADVPKTPASFEWFDLARAEEMLAIHDSVKGKEVAK